MLKRIIIAQQIYYVIDLSKILFLVFYYISKYLSLENEEKIDVLF